MASSGDVMTFCNKGAFSSSPPIDAELDLEPQWFHYTLWEERYLNSLSHSSTCIKYNLSSLTSNEANQTNILDSFLLNL